MISLLVVGWFGLILVDNEIANAANVIGDMILVGKRATLESTIGNQFTEVSRYKVNDDAQPLDCLSCHNIQLSFHDQLGQGNFGCWSCHVSTDSTMSELKLADDTQITFENSAQLCGQCHQKRYLAWQKGTHGIPGTIAAVPCTTCHNPHQPQMAFQDITKPPLPPLESTVKLPKDAVIITGTSIVFLLGIAIILARRQDVI